MTGGRLDAHAVRQGTAPAAYRSGFLALREGPLLEEALRALPIPFDVLLVDASGRDHPRRAGLALHLGARLGVPTIGVTDRPLVAQGEWPPDQQDAVSPVRVGEEIVGYWVRTVQGVRPLVVHAAWRTDAETAIHVVLDTLGGRRTPEPLRLRGKVRDPHGPSSDERRPAKDRDAVTKAGSVYSRLVDAIGWLAD